MHLFGLHLGLSPFFCGLVATKPEGFSTHTGNPDSEALTEVHHTNQTLEILGLTLQRISLLFLLLLALASSQGFSPRNGG
jgi:hypothetical protein